GAAQASLRSRAEAARRGRIAEQRIGADGRDKAAGGESAVLAAEPQIVADREVLGREIAADQPVEEAADRALQPELLGEGAEAAEGVAVIVAAQDVDVAVVGVRRRFRLVAAIGGD